MKFGIHSEQFQNDYSEEENRQFTAEFGSITEAMAEHMRAGTSPEDPSVQAIVKEHYEFCSRFWKPTREAYKSLALSYILPSPYCDSYESVAEGLGQYHYDAIVSWADENLE